MRRAAPKSGPGRMTPRQLAAWRNSHSYTLQESADALGIGVSTFCSLLKGDRAVPPTMALLCRAIDEIAALRARVEALGDAQAAE